MFDRDAYVQKMKAKLDEWNAEIDRLSAEADAAQADTRLRYNTQIEPLKKRREEALRRLNALQSASEVAWGGHEGWCGRRLRSDDRCPQERSVPIQILVHQQTRFAARLDTINDTIKVTPAQRDGRSFR